MLSFMIGVVFQRVVFGSGVSVFESGSGNVSLSFSVFLEIFSVIVVVGPMVAIIGLARRKSWARIITVVIIIVDSLMEINLAVAMLYIFLPGTILELIRPLISLLISISLLFLAYKIYTSKPLKVYLSKPQPDSR